MKKINPIKTFYYRVRRFAARLLNKLALKLHAIPGWDYLPQGVYDYVPKGKYIFGPADRFLLIPKNRYRTVLLPDQAKSASDGVGWITEDNTPASYDLLWGNTSHLEAFRAESNHVRDLLTIEIVDHIESYISPNAKVVDIGCGVGDLLKEIQNRKTVEVFGLDFSAKAIEGARLNFPDAQLKQFIIEKTLPYEDAIFDIVTCTDVLEHLEYPKLIVSELVRICKPGGMVAIVVPDGDVDQFFGHYWFWNEEGFSQLLSDWNAKILRLPKTQEFIAFIQIGNHPDEK